MNRPIRILAIFSLCLLVALMANITYVQYVEQKAYSKRSDNSRITNEAYSRQRGQILAAATSTGQPFVIAKSVASKAPHDLYKFQRVYGNAIAPSLPKDDANRNLYNASTAAEYAPITGYLTLGSQWGVERSQNAVLAGEDDRLFIDRVSNLLNNSDPQGGNVQLTIDPAVQDAAYHGLADKNYVGAAVAIDPTTGKILAMASTPSYDPNGLASHNQKESRAAYADVLKANALVNHASQDPRFPGSTFKLVTSAAAIQDLHFTPETMVNGHATTTIRGTDKITQNEDRASCGQRNADQVTFMIALDYSCNVAFAETGAKLSANNLTSMAEAFGFNTNPFSDVSPSTGSSYPNEPDAALRALSAYGQRSVQATPLQMALVAAGIGNHGVVMKPYLVDRLTSPTLDLISQTKPQAMSRPITNDTADKLTRMMVDVVNNGTGRNAIIPGVSVAGKTGTAETGTGGSPYAWFVSFGPADNAKIAIAVLVISSSTVKDNVAGGALCAPIARAMMQAYLNEGTH